MFPILWRLCIKVWRRKVTAWGFTDGEGLCCGSAVNCQKCDVVGNQFSMTQFDTYAVGSGKLHANIRANVDIASSRKPLFLACVHL
jgi:hypothetical protein